jgi:uncharacterized protein (AIM24 family)
MATEDFEISESVTAADGTVVDVLQYPQLTGCSQVGSASQLYFANGAGMRLKMVRLRLTSAHARLEPGALSHMKGNLQMQASTGGGIVKGLARKMMSGEKLFVNEVHGTGDVYLEPTYGHFVLHRIEADEGGIVVDRGTFCAGTAGLDISVIHQKNVSSALFGGEGLFQTRIIGAGVAVLFSPVPRAEIQVYTLTGDKLWVDGNFALIRSDTVEFRAEKSSKGWMSTGVSGEGLLQTFSGHGKVWLAPTRGVYEKLATPAGQRALALPPGAGEANNE